MCVKGHYDSWYHKDYSKKKHFYDNISQIHKDHFNIQSNATILNTKQLICT